MRGAIPPLPNTPSWHGTQSKKAQGQIYLYLYRISGLGRVVTEVCTYLYLLLKSGIYVAYFLTVKSVQLPGVLTL
jgi:hypothetical protein